MKLYRLLSMILAASMLITLCSGIIAFSSTVSAASDSAVLITTDTVWKYYDLGTDPAGTGARTCWTELSYDDSSWKSSSGKTAKFGAKLGVLGTLTGGLTPTILLDQYYDNGVNIPSYFFRTTFNLSSLPSSDDLVVGTVSYDDALIVYINGTKVASLNEPSGGFTSNLSYGGTGDSATSTFTVDPSVLKTGENIVAVELHQVNKTSSDVYFEMSGLTIGAGGQESLTLNVGSDETMRNVMWRFPTNVGRVEYAVRNGDTFPTTFKTANAVSTAHGSTFIHRATITDLQPDTEYVYRIANGSVVSDNYYFVTDPTDSFNFIFIGDAQIGASGSATTDGTNWRKTIALADNMFPNTSLLVSAGDQVDSGCSTSQYAQFLSPPELTSYAMATTIGNHDSGTAAYGGKSDYSYYFYNPNNTLNGNIMGATPAGGDYWYTYNNALFIHLNDNNLSVAEHKAFMKSAFEANPDMTWNIVVMHKSMFSGGGNYIKDPLVETRAALIPIFSQFDIDVVLSGHDHVYSRSYMITDGFTPNPSTASSVTDHEGVLYVTGGSSSASKYYGLLDEAQTPHVAKMEKNTTSFANVEITENSFKITTYRVNDSSVLDAFEIKKDKELHKTTSEYENIAIEQDYDAPAAGDWSANLTDGLSHANVTWNYKEWYGIKNGLNANGTVADIDFDFRTLYDISSVRLHILDGGVNGYAGIGIAKGFEVYTSTDGKAYTKAGDIEVKVDENATLHIYWTELVLDKTIEARYVRIRLYLPDENDFIMLNEVEVYGKLSDNAYDPEPVIRDNLALNKGYVTTTVNSSYPDENGISLTDGVVAKDDTLYSDDVYAAFHNASDDYKANGYAYITVDLGDIYKVDKFVAHLATQSQGAGIKAPQSLTVYVSEDNSVWTEAGAVTPYDSIVSCTVDATVSLTNAVLARYVQFRLVCNSNWIMVSEIEVYETNKVSANPELDKNIALNKTYTADGIYVKNGVVSYPDEDGVSLTDGTVAPPNATYSNTAYVGFNTQTDAYKANGYVSITVDLGKSYYMDKFVACVGTVFNGAGITAPSLMSVYVSDDNKIWTEASSVVPVDDQYQSCIEVTAALDESVQGRYVQFRFDSAKSWILISEVKVYEGEAPKAPVGKLGDVNNDSKVDSVDYLLVKRSCFNTYTLTDDEKTRADVDKSTIIDSVDYVLIKRIVFGTYVVQ